ncbi:MAG TPA: nitronate monooxygenase [Ideonella sp.]|uniref:NAD(P)H-dependent flavin oxidoreductase n=1 Tax=Ideonella sp. TaxID=1929293 RepID=UPI002CFE0AB0|nr:nitronate monooxygenase [Ideonella sp.]HSI48686.1 nitronate monooxygenase [Ideonella sp.]
MSSSPAAWLPSRLPIIQAPMAGSQDERLALAVHAAGALGSLPAAMLSLDGLDAALGKLQAVAGNAYNVNFFCHTPPQPDDVALARWRQALAPFYAEAGLDPHAVAAAASREPFNAAMAELLEAYRPAVVSFHFGLPSPELLARVQRLGCRVISSATTVREARWLAAQGVDGIIAQGLEAGGHRGHFLDTDPAHQLGTMALLPQVVAAVRLPVIAAGGIVDAASVRAALALGAAAVQTGTAYLLADEATTGPVHRAALVEPDTPTVLTRLFSGGLARGIVNRLMRELGPVSPLAPAFPQASGALAPLRAAAEKAGRGDFSPLWSGQNRSACRAAPAAEITAALARGLLPSS